MDDLAWDRNRERRERLWSKGEAAAPEPLDQPKPAPVEHPRPSLGERVAAREARQQERAARAGHRVILPTPRSRGPQQLEDDATLAAHPRPRTRADCVGGPRPCPRAGCKYHLYLDVSPETGSIKIHFAELEEMGPSCALDLADEHGGMTLEAVALIMGITRERVRQLEARGIELLKPVARHLR